MVLEPVAMVAVSSLCSAGGSVLGCPLQSCLPGSLPESLSVQPTQQLCELFSNNLPTMTKIVVNPLIYLLLNPFLIKLTGVDSILCS